MVKVFNSIFENSVRLAILLDVFATPEDLDMVYATDFMVSYGRIFALSQFDLNGDNPYMFSEFAARRRFVRDALKELVLCGMVKPSNASTGILYQITEAGSQFSRSLSSDYAKEYRSVAQSAVKRVDGLSSSTVISRINRMAARYRQREAAK